MDDHGWILIEVPVRWDSPLSKNCKHSRFTPKNNDHLFISIIKNYPLPINRKKTEQTKYKRTETASVFQHVLNRNNTCIKWNHKIKPYPSWVTCEQRTIETQHTGSTTTPAAVGPFIYRSRPARAEALRAQTHRNSFKISWFSVMIWRPRGLLLKIYGSNLLVMYNKKGDIAYFLFITD